MTVAKSESKRIRRAAAGFSAADIARLAVGQHQQVLKVRFPNIASVSDAVHDPSKPDSRVICLYLSDGRAAGIPSRLAVTMPDGRITSINTEIIKDAGTGRIQVNQYHSINGIDDPGVGVGSVCCIVDIGNGVKGAVTAGHVFSGGSSKNYGGELGNSMKTTAWINNIGSARWCFQIINFKNDIAVAAIDSWTEDPACIRFSGHYAVTDGDVRSTPVTLVSFKSGKRNGYILDHMTSWDVEYTDQTLQKNNIIVVGSSRNRDDSITVSQKGDSGGCVYEPSSGKLVGLIVGGNNRFTWVLPVGEILDSYGYALI